MAWLIENCKSTFCADTRSGTHNPCFAMYKLLGENEVSMLSCLQKKKGIKHLYGLLPLSRQ